MDRRLELQERLEQFLGSRQVYFQPPASIRLIYPCVVYKLGSGDARYANNHLYKYMHNYDVTFIFKQPSLGTIEQFLSEFSMSRLNATYCSDNLYHYVFSLYF